jgi:hypothetical protein
MLLVVMLCLAHKIPDRLDADASIWATKLEGRDELPLLAASCHSRAGATGPNANLSLPKKRPPGA